MPPTQQLPVVLERAIGLERRSPLDFGAVDGPLVNGLTVLVVVPTAARVLDDVITALSRGLRSPEPTPDSAAEASS